MPKMKTHKGTAKRFRVTGSGKLVRGRASKRHILEKKSAKRKRKLRKTAAVSSADQKTVKRMLGMG